MDDASAQYRIYAGIEKGHVDGLDPETGEVAETGEESGDECVIGSECHDVNHPGLNHDEFEAEVEADDAEAEVEDDEDQA